MARVQEGLDPKILQFYIFLHMYSNFTFFSVKVQKGANVPKNRR